MRSRTGTSEKSQALPREMDAYGGTPRFQALGCGNIITTLCGDLTITTDKGNLKAEESGPSVTGCKWQSQARL